MQAEKFVAPRINVPRTDRVFRGNEWEYGNHNWTHNPDAYTSYATTPKGVLADYADYAKTKIVQDEWQLEGILVAPKTELYTAAITAVFTHPERNSLKPHNGDIDDNNEDELKAFFLKDSGLLDSFHKTIPTITEPFASTNYDAYSSSVGFNRLWFIRPGIKRLFRRQEPDKNEYNIQLGVGYVTTDLAPIPSVESQEQFITKLLSQEAESLQRLDQQIEEAQQQLASLIKSRPQIFGEANERICTAEEELRKREERLRQATDKIPGL